MRVELGLAFSVCTFLHRQYNPTCTVISGTLIRPVISLFARATALKVLLIEMIFSKNGNQNRRPNKQGDQTKKSEESFKEACESASFQGVVFATSTN